MSIYGTSQVDVDYTFKVFGPELKTLRISFDALYKHKNSFDINGPKLESLDIKQAATSTYCLKNSRSLVSASISFNYDCAREQCLFSNSVISLLAAISSVKHLSVDPIPAYVWKVSILLHFLAMLNSSLP